MRAFYGDIHSHCGASYGHGPVEDALYNARLQLDFCSITGHALWPDRHLMAMPPEVIAYHQRGFARLVENWSAFVAAHAAACVPGNFIAFPSYESHSFEAGDYVVYHRMAPEITFNPLDFSSLQDLARTSSGEIFIIPHHIGYARGFRGINWDFFDEAASPLVEIISMHGCNESDEAPFPPLHTMGPRSSKQTMQAGLAAGRMFGVTGSTDHHSAHPGSFGWGLTGIWAEELTLSELWKAFLAKRTWAMSGDRIEVLFELDGAAMGSEVEGGAQRNLTWMVQGEGPLDYLEILKDNAVIHRADQTPTRPHPTNIGRLFFELGWGEKGIRQDWEVRLSIDGGCLTRITPKFRGIDTVDPLESCDRGFRLSAIDERGETSLAFRTTTWGNPTASTPATQACGLEITHDGDGVLEVQVNGTTRHFPLADLALGSVSFHLGGFLSGAVRVSRLVPPEETVASGSFADHGPAGTYYLRVRQRNNHWAWTSPIRFRR